jgi:hypothetical protein
VKNTADVTGGKPIAVLLQSISGVSAINPLVAFYDIHGGKREALFFYFVPDTTRDVNFFHTKFGVVVVNGLVLPPAQFFYFNGQSLIYITIFSDQ